jgi:hypothetical protein
LRRFCYSIQGFEICVFDGYAALMLVSYRCFSQPIGPIFKDQTGGLSQNIGN